MYFFVVLFLMGNTLLTILNDKNNIIFQDRKVIKNGYIISCILMIVLSICRSREIGQDMINYCDWYDGSKFGERYEIGFNVLGLFVKNLGSDMQGFMAVCAVLTLIPFFFFFYKCVNERALILVLMLFFLTQYVRTFSILRAYLSLAYIVLGVYFQADKKYIKTIICWGMAFLFHKSSILFGLMLLVANHIKKKTVFIAVAVLGILSNSAYLREYIFNILVKTNSGRYIAYKEEIYNAQPSELLIGIYFLLMLFLIINHTKIDLTNQMNQICYNVTWFMFLMCIFYYWLPSYTRIEIQGVVFAMIVFGNTLSNIEDMKKRILIGSVSVVIGIAFFFINGMDIYYIMG